MDLKLLEDFVCLAQLQNFTAAARERLVTQSAFSRRIKALEEWVGTDLVNRDCTPLALTPQGKLFYREAEVILRKLYNCREEVRALGKTSEREIAVAAQNSIAQTLFLDWVKRVERNFGSIYVRLVSEKLIDCVELFTQGHVDYLFCYAHKNIGLPLDDSRFEYTLVGREKLIPVSVPNGQTQEPLFALPGNPAEPVPFVAYTHEALFGKSIDQLLQDKDHRCYVQRRYENPFSHTLKSMVLEKLGFAWLPYSSILTDLRDGRLCRAGDEHWDLDFDIRLYHHSRDSELNRIVLQTSREMDQRNA
ncbi:transcriptional regulator [Marinobacterium aestuarii]|uniref:Transcriptional regulator n=1 Tax=Marinobacterium aestuarii TaxID=1821621 RepID=A0A1A9F3B2_9GAMM|nr:LysR substrate-binding domain-containing protein [Marinobacterium aestuarii]ANG64665.1 transcriptional regulator [Marinobacterium aestuarii]